MANCVCNGAKISCSFGDGPKSMVVLPLAMTTTANTKALAVNTDIIPMLNIPSFGQCKSPANPMVAAATVAALGVLTPQPCIPVIIMPWNPASQKLKIGKMPAILDNSQTMCAWAGQIQVTDPGQTTITSS
jgi:hypothetical protein